MGRRSSWQFQQQERERKEAKRMNPVWRGVGCLLVVVIGVLGYLFANWFLVQNSIKRWVFLPRELINPNIPGIGDFLAGGNLVRIAVALLFLLFSFAFLNFFYAIVKPIRPGETDVATPKRQGKKRRY